MSFPVVALNGAGIGARRSGSQWLVGMRIRGMRRL